MMCPAIWFLCIYFQTSFLNTNWKVIISKHGHDIIFTINCYICLTPAMTAELSDWAGRRGFNIWKGQEVVCSSPLLALDPTYFLLSRYEWLFPVVRVTRAWSWSLTSSLVSKYGICEVLPSEPCICPHDAAFL